MRRLVLTAPLCVAAAAHGDVIISNINATSTSGTVFGSCATTIYKAGGFTMPAGDDYTLDKVLFAMDYAYSGGGQLGRYTVWSGTGAPAVEETTLSPLGPQVGTGIFEFAPDTPLTLEAGKTYWVYVQADPAQPTGCMLWMGDSGGLLPSGIATHAGYLFNGNPSSFANRYEVQGTRVIGCYPDCDGNGALDLFDFLCFTNKFNAGDPYADCDGSGSLDLFDFLCFTNAFNAGCP